MADVNSPYIKKKYGQHFLRWQWIADLAVNMVSIDAKSSIFEIGCGDGFLTRTILKTDCARLWVFEIDPDWVQYVQKTIHDKRLTLYQQDILTVDFAIFDEHKPWTLLANLPYQITFPILYKLFEHRHLLKEAVIMIQEEVAEKILKTYGRGYGVHSLFFQHYFMWKSLEKVPPAAFEPPPKVHSRLLYFKPKENVTPIKQEQEFWDFVKLCFKYPRRTLKNNIVQTQYAIEQIPSNYLELRAQQMTMNDFLIIWDILSAKN